MPFRRAANFPVSLLLVLAGCTASLDLDDLQSRPSDQPAGGAGATLGGGSGGGSGKGGQGLSAGASGGAGRGGQAGLGGGASAGGAGSGAGAGGSGPLAGAAGAGGGGTAGSATVAGAGGAAAAGMGGAGLAGAGGAAGAGVAGQAGSGTASGGAGGAPALICPRQATVLDTLSTLTATYRDLHTNGAQLAFFNSQDGNLFRLRPATLETTKATEVIALVDGTPHAVRFGADTNMFIFSAWRVYFTPKQDGTPLCQSDAPGWALAMGTCDGTDRRIVTEGQLVAQVGCGEQAVGATNAGGQTCGNGEYLRSKDGSGTLGSATESIAIALRSTKLYTVDRVGPAYLVREKAYPTVKGSTAYVGEPKTLGTIDTGTPRGLFVEAGFAYTSVQAPSGLWDIRRYKLGAEDDLTVLYEGIADLTAFALKDGKLVWAREGGAASAGATLWRGALGGAAFTPPTLAACAPVAPVDLQVTPDYVFFVDPRAVEGKPPSLRGAAHSLP